MLGGTTNGDMMKAILHIPVWFTGYLHEKDENIVLVKDGNSGEPINTFGL